MRYTGTHARTVGEALALGPALLARARDERAVYLAASVVRGPAVVLGASQRAGRVLDLDACRARGVPVFRRASSGTAARLEGQGLLWTLALPAVNALAPDALPATLLNRNVRGFLQGLTRAGAPAHYFGREWISVQHRPAVLLGFDALPCGATLLELLAGYDLPFALPAGLASERERATPRWLGKEPLALGDAVARARSPEQLAERVAEGCAARWGTSLEPASLPPPAPFTPIDEPLDPAPSGAVAGEPVACAVGWVEAAVTPARDALWLGGDVLAPRFALDAIAASLLRGEDMAVDESALLGARADELVRAGRNALGPDRPPRG